MGVVVVGERVRVAVPVPPDDRLMLVVLKVALRPVGETVSASFTVPVKP